MSSLIALLCFHLDCTPNELDEYLEEIEIKMRNCPVRTLHLKHKQKRFLGGGITLQGANTLKAFRGKHGVTVAQYYFARHKVDLKYPSLPCVVELGGNGHESYFPLEVLTYDKYFNA